MPGFKPYRKRGASIWILPKVRSERIVSARHGRMALLKSHPYTWRKAIWKKKGIEQQSLQFLRDKEAAYKFLMNRLAEIHLEQRVSIPLPCYFTLAGQLGGSFRRWERGDKGPVERLRSKGITVFITVWVEYRDLIPFVNRIIKQRQNEQHI